SWMEIKKLRHCLSFLLSLFITFPACLTGFSQDFSHNNSVRSGSVAADDNDRTAKPGAISSFTSRVTPEGYDRMWQMTGPFGGDVTVLTIDPNNADRILIGSSDGQIYRSTDGGTIWKRLRPGINAAGFIIK